jgi:hypothetical protein
MHESGERAAPAAASGRRRALWAACRKTSSVDWRTTPRSPDLHRDWARPPPHHGILARPGHICAGTWLAPGHCGSAFGLGLTPHLHRDWGSPLPHPHRDWAHAYHICTGTGLTPTTSAPGLGSPLPHLHRDWAHRVPTARRPDVRRSLRTSAHWPSQQRSKIATRQSLAWFASTWTVGLPAPAHTHA